MKTLNKSFILLTLISFVLISALNCFDVKPKWQEGVKNGVMLPKEADTPQETTAPPVSQPGTEKSFQDTFGNRINYGNPGMYLTSGIQSNLNEKYFDDINTQIRMGNNDLENIGAIFKWKQSHFKTYAAAGKFIGKITVNQIIEEMALSGCHDHGLVLVSILRKYKLPAIMVDTAGIQWALDYTEGKRDGVRGHVFIEVYVKDRWILINSTSGEYVENYDPCNPVIPMTDSVESKGYYVLFKGLDPERYGINSNDALTESLKVFAGKVTTIEMSSPPYKVKRLP